MPALTFHECYALLLGRSMLRAPFASLTLGYLDGINAMAATVWAFNPLFAKVGGGEPARPQILARHSFCFRRLLQARHDDMPGANAATATHEVGANSTDPPGFRMGTLVTPFQGSLLSSIARDKLSGDVIVIDCATDARVLRNESIQREQQWRHIGVRCAWGVHLSDCFRTNRSSAADQKLVSMVVYPLCDARGFVFGWIGAGFDAAQTCGDIEAQMVANLAEVATREMDHAAAAHKRLAVEQKAASSESKHRQLMKALEAVQDVVLIVNCLGGEGWAIGFGEPGQDGLSSHTSPFLYGLPALPCRPDDLPLMPSSCSKSRLLQAVGVLPARGRAVGLLVNLSRGVRADRGGPRAGRHLVHRLRAAGHHRAQGRCGGFHRGALCAFL